jgi:hypothetical protein
MTPVYEPGKIANWIAPPRKTNVKDKPFEFEYVNNYPRASTPGGPVSQRR